MNSSGRRRWLAGLVLGVIALTAGGRAQGPAVPRLFGPPPAGARVPAVMASRIDTLQARPVTVRTAALASEVLDIELTTGRVVRAQLERREVHRSGAQTWAGSVVGESLSSVTLVSDGAALQGSVRMLDGSYSIEAAGNGLHVIRQVDAAATGAELEPLPAPIEPDPLAADDAPIAGDDGSTIDVLAFYTADAVTAALSEQNVRNRIALGISETNTAYANSGISARLRLVGAELTNYTESGNLSTDLSFFRSSSDGQMDEVHTRRDALGADMAVLVVGNTAGGACGVAYVMTALSAGFASSAFSVTAYPCISPNYTFGHELGHNMGSAHAPEDGASQASLYPYSFGYKNPSELFRTVMAYDCTSGCPRVLHFSNPNVNYAGAVTGTGAQHDNARSINNAALTIANWRQAIGGGAAPTISAISNVTIDEDAATGTIAFTVDDAETAAASLVVTASSSNTTLVPNTGAALALGGSGANRTLVVTPAANRSGTSTITLTVNDGARTGTRAFTLTVTAVNDAPTVTRSPVSGTIASGLDAQTTVTVTDIDTAGNTLTLATSSSNTTLLPNAAITVATGTTTATSRTFTVTMTPAPNQAGTAVVTLTAGDGVAMVPTTYTLTVTVPQPPTIGVVGPQSTPEDTSRAVAFTVGDADTPLEALVVTATSSNTSVVPASGLVLSGADTARTLTVTPAANAFGTSTLTLAVNDGLVTVQTSFVMTVTSVNDRPTFAAGIPTSISTIVSTATSFPVTINDPDTAPSTLTLTASTSNQAVLAPGGITISPVSATATSRTFDVTVMPVAGATGNGGIELLGSDLLDTVGRAVGLTVTSTPAAPDAPTTLTATVSGSTLTLSWTAPTTGSTPESYTVHVGNAAGATTLPVLTTTGTSIGIPITAGGTYFARVRSVNGYGTSGPSPEVSFTLATPNPRPGAPTGLTASFSGRTITLTWMAPTSGNPVTNYSLEVGSSAGLSNILVVPIGPGTSFVSPGVPDGVYWIRVRGANAAGSGPASEDLGVAMSTAGGCVGLPYAPVMLAPEISGTQITLSWNAPAGAIAPLSYVLYAGSAPGRSNLAVFDLGSTATTFTTTAPPGTYFVRVAARNGCAAGAPSNETTASVSGTSGGGVVPLAPSGLTASVAGTIVTLSWVAPATGAVPTGYVVDVGSISGSANLGSINTSTATAISGSAAPGTYHLRVRTRAGTLLSAPSSSVVVVVP